MAKRNHTGSSLNQCPGLLISITWETFLGTGVKAAIANCGWSRAACKCSPKDTKDKKEVKRSFRPQRTTHYPLKMAGPSSSHPLCSLYWTPAEEQPTWSRPLHFVFKCRRNKHQPPFHGCGCGRRAALGDRWTGSVLTITCARGLWLSNLPVVHPSQVAFPLPWCVLRCAGLLFKWVPP